MTPEQEEQVRRALASAPPAGAIPPEVAARLDATLADLVADRAAARTDDRQDSEGPTPVVALEERRRRRWPRVLVAAASVSVLAYGAGIALDGLQVSGGSDESTAARDSTFSGADAGGAADGGSEAAPEDAPTGLLTGSDGPEAEASRVDGRALLVPRTVRLHRATLADDVARLVERARPDLRDPSPTKAQDVTGFLSRCAQPDTARGDRLAAVRLDGRRATLVVRRAVGGTRVAEVYSCGDASRLLAITRLPSAR